MFKDHKLIILLRKVYRTFILSNLAGYKSNVSLTISDEVALFKSSGKAVGVVLLLGAKSELVGRLEVIIKLELT